MSPVLILGAGINGCAVARELALNGVPVWVVDSGDVSRGATSRSSRLIHGGLRYLEYRDIRLVRESLEERERLLNLAPQFVTPLRLRIPIQRRLGGLWSGALKFTGIARTILGTVLAIPSRTSVRGLWAVRFGLSLYDWLAGRSSLPGHQVLTAARRAPLLSRDYRWLCEFSDCQMLYPERFVLALLHDAQSAAASHGQTFAVRTYCEASYLGGSVSLSSQSSGASTEPAVEHVTPAVIVNATGAWGDRTLKSLGASGPQLFAGTKGSHLFTPCKRLLQALDGCGIYAEAPDGRLVFILPCASGVLIGTTDEPFNDSPESAVASDVEIDYLLGMVNLVLPEIRLERHEVEMHHAGVRPLPNVVARSAAAIPRGHAIERTALDDIPVLTLVGGKLTTCRALAAEVTDTILEHLGQRRVADTWERIVSGADQFPRTSEAQNAFVTDAMNRFGLDAAQIECLLRLIGNRFDEVFGSTGPNPQTSLVGTAIPLEFVRWSLRNEWCTSLEDLVERRLMLIFNSPLRMSTLEALAAELINAGMLDEKGKRLAIEQCVHRLSHFYGKTVLLDQP